MNIDFKYEIDFPVQQVWEIISQFGNLDDLHCNTIHSQLLCGGIIRKITTPLGGMLWERLLTFSENAKQLEYEIIDIKNVKNIPYGIGYKGKIEVKSIGCSRSLLIYNANFDLLKGFSEEEAHSNLAKYTQGLIDGINRLLRYKL